MIHFRKNMQQKNEIRKDFSVIILAAGNSSRMGFPKLALKYSDSKTFIEHIANEYDRFGCTEIILVVNVGNFKYFKDNMLQLPKRIEVVVNDHPEWHRFYSLKKGIQALRKKTMVFMHNVDNPFVSQDTLDLLIKYSKNADYISPEFKGRGGHPVLLSEKIVSDILKSNKDQVHLKEFINQFQRRKVEVPDENILVNINDKKEYIKFKEKRKAASKDSFI